MREAFSFKHIAIALVTAWILVFIMAPNLMVAVVSLLERSARDIVAFRFTLEHYRALLDPVYAKIFYRSFVYSAVTTLICLAVGFPFAFLLARTTHGYRRLLLLLVIIPFWTSSLIRTYALVIILKANGIINTALMAAGIIDRPLELLYTDLAVYTGLVYTLLPFMILPLYATLEKMDFGLVEAAYDLGAGPVKAFLKVILPLSMPGVIAGGIMVFLPAMGLFYVPDLLGGAKSMLLGNLIKNQFLVAGNWPFGAAASIWLTLVMLALITIYFRVMKRFSTSVMEGGMKQMFKKGYLTLVYLFLYIPILVLIVYSFNSAKYASTWKGITLGWYMKLFENEMLMEAMVHSLYVALTASIVATIIGTLGALAFYRYRFAGRKALYAMVYATMMSPDIVMGISLLTLFMLMGIKTGFFTLFLAHVTFCLPFVIVTVYARISGFDPAVIDAARDLGAGEYRIFRHIILPMTAPAVAAGWLLSFTLSLDDVIVSFFVTGPGFEILPLKIYSMVRLGVKPEVNALCTLLFMFTLLSVMAAHFLVKEKTR